MGPSASDPSANRTADGNTRRGARFRSGFRRWRHGRAVHTTGHEAQADQTYQDKLFHRSTATPTFPRWISTLGETEVPSVPILTSPLTFADGAERGAQPASEAIAMATIRDLTDRTPVSSARSGPAPERVPSHRNSHGFRPSSRPLARRKRRRICSHAPTASL